MKNEFKYANEPNNHKICTNLHITANRFLPKVLQLECFLQFCCVNTHIGQTLKEAFYQNIVIVRNYFKNSINIYKKC